MSRMDQHFSRYLCVPLHFAHLNFNLIDYSSKILSEHIKTIWKKNYFEIGK